MKPTQGKDKSSSDTVADSEEKEVKESLSPSVQSDDKKDVHDEANNSNGEQSKIVDKQQSPNIPGLHMSKSAIKKQKKKQAEMRQKEAENSKELEAKVKGNENDHDDSKTPTKATLEERWMSHIRKNGKHKLSPDDKERSVRPRSVSPLNLL